MTAASAGATPFASSPPMMPVSTSPVPAVASAGPSVGLTWTSPVGLSRSRCPGPSARRSRRCARPASRAACDAIGTDCVAGEALVLAGVRRQDRRREPGGVADAQRRRVGRERVRARRRRRRPEPALRRPGGARPPGRGRRGRGRDRPRARGSDRGPSTRAAPLPRRGARRSSPAARASTISVPAKQRGSLDAGHAAHHHAGARTARAGATRHQRRADHAGRAAEHHAARPTTCARPRRGAAGRGRRPRRPRSRARRHRCRCRRRARVPRRVRPGSKSRPGFSAAKQTVSSACTASPRTSPVAPSTPDGMSTASVGTAAAPRRPRPSPAAPSSAPRKPVPNIASTNRSARASARSNATAIERRRRSRRRRPRRPAAAARGPRPDRRRRCCPCRTRRRPAGRTTRPASPRGPRPRPRARPARRGPLRASRLRSRAGRPRPSPQASGQVAPPLCAIGRSPCRPTIARRRRGANRTRHVPRPEPSTRPRTTRLGRTLGPLTRLTHQGTRTAAPVTDRARGRRARASARSSGYGCVVTSAASGPRAAGTPRRRRGCSR